MERIEYRTKDKSAWLDGPWKDEPDKVQWQDEATGLPCLIVRAHHRGWCGYVGVAPGHPWYGLRPRDPGPSDCDIHDDITYANPCSGGDESEAICHVPGPGEPDHVWWFGFSCAGAFDLLPTNRTLGNGVPIGDEEYRDIEFVTAEVVRLAAQIAAANVKG